MIKQVRGAGMAVPETLIQAVGIPPRSAPVSSDNERLALLIAAIGRELGMIKYWNAQGPMVMTHDAIQRILLQSRPKSGSTATRKWKFTRSRPSLKDDDAQVLRDIRSANPGSDGRKEFYQAIGPHLSVQRQRFRYNRAHRKIAQEDGD